MIHNKTLAGRKVIVSEEISKDGFIEFDDFGNLKTKISNEAEEMLLSIPDYHKGESDAKTPLVQKKPKEKEVVNLEEEVVKLKKQLAEKDAEISGLKKKIEELEKGGDENPKPEPVQAPEKEQPQEKKDKPGKPGKPNKNK